jgi:transcriptional regulator with XRE-family HTH domain
MKPRKQSDRKTGKTGKTACARKAGMGVGGGHHKTTEEKLAGWALGFINRIKAAIISRLVARIPTPGAANGGAGTLTHIKSQADLALAAGISPCALSLILAARRAPSADTIIAIADALGCSVDFLLYGKGNPGAFATIGKNENILQTGIIRHLSKNEATNKLEFTNPVHFRPHPDFPKLLLSTIGRFYWDGTQQEQDRIIYTDATYLPGMESFPLLTVPVDAEHVAVVTLSDAVFSAFHGSLSIAHGFKLFPVNGSWRDCSLFNLELRAVGGKMVPLPTKSRKPILLAGGNLQELHPITTETPQEARKPSGVSKHSTTTRKGKAVNLTPKRTHSGNTPSPKKGKGKEGKTMNAPNEESPKTNAKATHANKLTPRGALAILQEDRKQTMTTIAAKHGVHRTVVGKILSGALWRHVFDAWVAAGGTESNPNVPVDNL